MRFLMIRAILRQSCGFRDVVSALMVTQRHGSGALPGLIV